MVTFLGIILSILYFSVAYYNRDDLFSPGFIFNAYAWLKNVPYFIQIGGQYSDDLIFKYFFIKVLGWFMVNLGVNFYKKRLLVVSEYSWRDIVDIGGERKVSRYFYAGWIFLILGALIKIYIVTRAGGLSYVLQHLQARGQILAGYGYVNTFSNYFLNCSVLCIEYYMCKTNKGRSSFSISVILSTLFLLVFGARKPVLMLWIKVLICYHYCKREIKLKDLLKPKYILLVVAVFFFMLMIPMLRYYENSTIYLNPTQWASEALDNVNSIFREFSYLTGDMFVLEYFNLNNYWLGQVYLNIFVQWIPRSLFPNKPPMDDGMYLYNMMQGYQVTPNMSTGSLGLQTSVPFTMEGALFANFGYIGVFLGCFFIGLLYQHVYKMLIQTDANIYMIMIYQVILLEFVPSVLHTVSPLICIIFTSIIVIPILRIKIYKVKDYST